MPQGTVQQMPSCFNPAYKPITRATQQTAHHPSLMVMVSVGFVIGNCFTAEFTLPILSHIHEHPVFRSKTIMGLHCVYSLFCPIAGAKARFSLGLLDTIRIFLGLFCHPAERQISVDTYPSASSRTPDAVGHSGNTPHEYRWYNPTNPRCRPVHTVLRHPYHIPRAPPRL